MRLAARSAGGSESVRRDEILDYGLVLIPLVVVNWAVERVCLGAAAAVRNHSAEDQEQAGYAANDAADYGADVC